jgi:hypothetical protein
VQPAGAGGSGGVGGPEQSGAEPGVSLRAVRATRELSRISQWWLVTVLVASTWRSESAVR